MTSLHQFESATREQRVQFEKTFGEIKSRAQFPAIAHETIGLLNLWHRGPPLITAGGIAGAVWLTKKFLQRKNPSLFVHLKPLSSNRRMAMKATTRTASIAKAEILEGVKFTRRRSKVAARRTLRTASRIAGEAKTTTSGYSEETQRMVKRGKAAFGDASTWTIKYVKPGCVQ